MRVLLTRTADRCEKTSRKIAAEGHAAVILPLAMIEDIGEPIPASAFDAIAFTSAASPLLLARRIGKQPGIEYLINVPVWCVGKATASSAREAGFSDVREGAGDAAALAALVARAYSRAAPGTRLLCPVQQHAAFDLAAALPGLETAVMPLYRIAEIDPGRDRLAEALGQSEAVFLYSPRSAAHLARIALEHGLEGTLMGLTLVAISEKTAQALGTRKPAFIAVAETPDEDAMIRLLEELAGGKS
jgi:uroporphyrinogen-III synthase